MYSTVTFKTSDHKGMLDWINSQFEISNGKGKRFEVRGVWLHNDEIHVLYSIEG